LISLAGLLLSNGLILLLETPLGKMMSKPELGYLPAKVVATGVVVIWNFVANRVWTFNDVG
jgi:putative flippase GtrA